MTQNHSQDEKHNEEQTEAAIRSAISQFFGIPEDAIQFVADGKLDVGSDTRNPFPNASTFSTSTGADSISFEEILAAVLGEGFVDGGTVGGGEPEDKNEDDIDDVEFLQKRGYLLTEEQQYHNFKVLSIEERHKIIDAYAIQINEAEERVTRAMAEITAAYSALRHMIEEVEALENSFDDETDI